MYRGEWPRNAATFCYCNDALTTCQAGIAAVDASDSNTSCSCRCCCYSRILQFLSLYPPLHGSLPIFRRRGSLPCVGSRFSLVFHPRPYGVASSASQEGGLPLSYWSRLPPITAARNIHCAHKERALFVRPCASRARLFLLRRNILFVHRSRHSLVTRVRVRVPLYAHSSPRRHHLLFWIRNQTVARLKKLARIFLLSSWIV